MGISFVDIPSLVADKLNISIFASGLLCSGIILFMVTLPVIIILRGKNVMLFTVIVQIIFMGFCIAITWLPYYFLIIYGLLVALLFSGKIRELTIGR